MIKGLGPTPADVAYVFENRKRIEQTILTSHGEAGQYFVTFLDNHDQGQRFGFTGASQLIDQLILGYGILLALPGVPCVYYGSEQGLTGHKTSSQTDDSMVREALWGKVDAAGNSVGFNKNHPLYVALQALGKVRADQPALRYGRYYFRPISGNGVNFGLSPYPTGILAFSRNSERSGSAGCCQHRCGEFVYRRNDRRFQYQRIRPQLSRALQQQGQYGQRGRPGDAQACWRRFDRRG